MVDCKRIFEETRAKVLRGDQFTLFKKHFIIPGVPHDKLKRPQGSDSRAKGRSRRDLSPLRKKQARDDRSNDVAARSIYHEMSLRGRALSKREFNEFRNLVSGEIKPLDVDWKDLDQDPKLQARLYAHLGSGLIRIVNIPKIPLKYEPKSMQFLGIDSEDNSYGIPHFYQIATRDYVYISSSFHLLFRYVVQTHHLSKSNHIVWGTNIEYEFGNIVKDFDRTFQSIKIKWRKGRLSRFDLVYKPEALTWAGEDDARGSMRVWDTMNHWMMGVKEMGKFLSDYLGFDFTKLEANYYGFKYAAMDAIISRSYAAIQKEYYDRKGIELLTTPGATALKLYLKGIEDKKFCHHKIYKTHTEDELDWLMEGLRGGRTEVFSLREHVGCTSYLDINSAYPYAMKYPFYPNLTGHFWLDSHEAIRKHIDYDFEGMAEVDVEAIDLHPFAMVYPYLGAKDEDTLRFIFPLGKWKAKYTFFEIRKAEELGYKFKFKKAIVYERCTRKHPFKDYVDFCYNIRLEGQEKGEKLLKDIGKGLGNNLYGKWGQRMIFTIFDDPGKYQPDDLIHCTQMGNGVLIEQADGYASHANVIWGAYITSICRDLLYQHMMKAWENGNHILYCDTDSIFITGGKLPEHDDSRLGALKHEGDLYYFKAYLPKQYEYQYLDRETGKAKTGKDGKVTTVYKSKGVPQWHEKLDEQGRAVLDEKGQPVIVNLRERFFATGNAEFRKPLKLREALRRKNIKDKNVGRGVDAVNAWVTITKELKGSYTKREVLKNNWTLPHWIGMKKPDWYAPPEAFLKE